MKRSELPKDSSRDVLRVLLLSRYASLGASSRIRSIQFLDHLRCDGLEIELSSLFDDRYLQRLYRTGGKSLWLAAVAYLRRIRVLMRARRFDLLWIEKELFPYLPAIAERWLRRLGVAMLVDYDDAIFHNYDRAGSTVVRRLLGGKIDAVMRTADIVVAGSEYIAERAEAAGAARIERIPTVVDLARYPLAQTDRSSLPFTVGWIGSPSTQGYLAPLRTVWGELADVHGTPLRAIGATSEFAGHLGVDAVAWTEAGEAASLDGLDVGVMPLDEGPWERGKCGYKLIQYMASWKPVIASPIGVNTEIVSHGVNGFLAATPSEWRQAIATLARDRDLCMRMGRAGRQRVENHYSLESARPKLTACLREAATPVLRARPQTIVLFANTDWYLYNFRRSLALTLRENGFDVLLLSPDGEYGRRLRALGLRWQPVPMRRRSLNPLRELLFVRLLARLFRHHQPVLVHGFTIKCALYGSLAARLAGVPAQVNAVAGLGYLFASRERKARLLRPAVSLLMRMILNGRNSRLILQNPDDVAEFEQTGLVDRTRIREIPGSGVDTRRFTSRARRYREIGEPMTVLLASRLLWDKGVAEYVAAARQLRTGARTIRFLLAGCPDPGNPGSVPESTVREWADEGAVECLGQVDDMPSLLARVDAMVLPTSYREGLPKSLIEAAACGLPIIASDAPGCREVVRHEHSGLLVPARDSAALVEAICRLHDDPQLARRLGEAARRRALSEYDERIIIERTLAVYREVMTDQVLPAT